MRFTIVTPSFNQLDWLELCVASVRDQMATKAETGDLSVSEGKVNEWESGKVERYKGGSRSRALAGRRQREAVAEGNVERCEGMKVGKCEGGGCAETEGIFIEHIVQDAGTPGIEEFALRMGADFYQDGKKVFSAQCSVYGESAGAKGKKADSTQCTSWSPRRPVSSNLGSVDSQFSEGYSLTIYSEKDGGMYDAINRGLRKASGEICAYLNCDEQYLPGTLRWVADYFAVAPETEVLFGAAIVTRADGSYVCDRRVMVPTRWHTMVSGNLSIFTSSTFFPRKSVVERGLLFDPQWRVCGDAVWALRFLEAGLRMQATHKPLSAFAETGVNMSATGNPRAAEESRRLALSAPAAARVLKPAVLLAYRFRRWLSGAYALKPHGYAVYTARGAGRRQRFDVNRPSFRWQMGAG